MTDSQQRNPFVTQLLRQDHSLKETEYKEYRMQLEQALTRTERREKLTLRVAFITGPLAFVLLIIGGSGVVGGFDPWDKDATPLSITLAVVYAVCAALFPLSIASYYSRYRPRIRDLQERLRDASIQSLRGEIAELRKQVESLNRGTEQS